MKSFKEQYAEKLRSVFGTNFQSEMEKIFQQNIQSFQTITIRPSGDGGLDGISDNQTIAYCCYGLDLISGDLSKPQVLKKIKEKFKSDLMRLLELTNGRSGSNKNKMAHKPNTALKGIIASHRKIQHIHLYCNWFDDNTLVGHFQKILDELKKKSKLNFVNSDCSIVFRGPREIVQRFNIGPDAILRLENPGLLEKIENPDGLDTPLATIENMLIEEKFEYLIRLKPNKKEAIQTLQSKFVKKWQEGIALIRAFELDHPGFYREIEQARQNVRISAELSDEAKSIGEASEQIKQYTEELKSEFKKLLPEGFLQRHIENLSEYSLAWLLGVCHLDWRPENEQRTN